MAIPPFVDLRLGKGEPPTKERLEELCEAYARNFEDLYNRFQTQEATNEAGNEFLRLLTKGKRRLAEGEGELEWAGGTNESKATTVTHGLGVEPRRVLATPKGAGAARLSVPEVEARAKTTFTVRAWTPYGAPAAGSKLKFDWIAIS